MSNAYQSWRQHPARYASRPIPQELRGRVLDSLEPLRRYAHAAGDCAGGPCVIHSPSRHALSSCRYYLGDTWLILRICAHGVMHPDPDSLRFLDPDGSRGLGSHECDRCCAA